MHIGYFSLLLFCISTNMIRCMHLEELTRPQTDGSNRERSLSSELLAIISPPKTSPPPIKTRAFNLQWQSAINHLSPSSSSTAQQYSPQTLTRKRKLTQEQSENRQIRRTDMPEQGSIPPSLELMVSEINAQSTKLSKTKSPIPSDGEDSTVFDREFDDQEALISEQPSSKQPPRKKRGVNKEDIPVKEPEQLVQFSVNCPEPKCQDILGCLRERDLKMKLFTHILKKHSENKNNYSIKSLATHVKENCKKELVSAQEQLKNIHFTIACHHCPLKPQLQNSLRSNLITKFKRHLENCHSSMTEEQKKTYIEENLQKPELPVQFSINCPESKCKHITRVLCRSNLKKNLFKHISARHPKNGDNYSKEFLVTYVKENCTTRLHKQ